MEEKVNNFIKNRKETEKKLIEVTKKPKIIYLHENRNIIEYDLCSYIDENLDILTSIEYHDLLKDFKKVFIKKFFSFVNRISKSYINPLLCDRKNIGSNQSENFILRKKVILLFYKIIHNFKIHYFNDFNIHITNSGKII